MPRNSLAGMEQTRYGFPRLFSARLRQILMRVVQNTAALWASKGAVVKPTNEDGSVAGKSGLDAELGPGLYLTDTLTVYVPDTDS
jgi:hypothetical protein